MKNINVKAQDLAKFLVHLRWKELVDGSDTTLIYILQEYLNCDFDVASKAVNCALGENPIPEDILEEYKKQWEISKSKKLNKKQKEVLKKYKALYQHKFKAGEDNLCDYFWVFGHCFRVEENGDVTEI